MNSSGYRARRATLDDLDTLREFWQAMRFDVPDLERRLTEFQVAEDPDGRVVGAVGFQTVGRHACIHSEAFADFSLADTVRPSLWNRIQSLCLNHAIARLWTREDAPFWTRTGFQPASDTLLSKLPEAWNRADAWLTLQLKDEEVIASLDKEFALFVESEKRNTAQALGQAHTLRMIVMAIGVLFVLALIGATIYLLLTRKASGAIGP